MFKNVLILTDKKQMMKEYLDKLSEFKGLVDYSNLENLYEYLEYCDTVASVSPEAYKQETFSKVSSSTLRKWNGKYLKGYHLADYINISDLLYLYLLENPYPNCNRDTFDNKRYYVPWNAKELSERYYNDSCYNISESMCRSVLKDFYTYSGCKTTDTILLRNRRKDIAIISWYFNDKPERKILKPTYKRPPLQTEFTLRINAFGYVGAMSKKFSQGDKVLIDSWKELIIDEVDLLMEDTRIKTIYLKKESERSCYILEELRQVYDGTEKRFALCD